MRKRNHPIDDGHVVAIHPGPGPDFRFPARPLPPVAERLAAVERELLDGAIERFVSTDGRLGGLAVRVIALRAEVGR